MFLHNIIIKTIPKADSYIENSFKLVKELDGRRLSNEFQLMSLDVVSFFTNVPIDYEMDCINHWSFISRDCCLLEEEFIKAFHFVLDSTLFVFDSVTYKQNYDTPMGFPLSPVIADLVMQRLESRALSSIRFPLPFYYRYVDDIIMAPDYSVSSILEIFNSQHPRLQFTMEVGSDRLNFLDVVMIRDNETIEFDWYHKPTFSGRYFGSGELLVTTPGFVKNRVQKDPVPRSNKSNAVYKLSCKDCDASYVGQTYRQLKTKVTEHKNHI
ncbi:uncharacterized protein [Mycetomoellerius zeteki]|uniref:uncharacterized protein n=1 Tax=Mycetomoellerius zeteki TaxID=64791 RepID=UPI00084E8423|nr:PREDICTED: uncharacterized protein LOC108727022 [Trachymyrmex zeteki]